MPKVSLAMEIRSACDAGRVSAPLLAWWHRYRGEPDDPAASSGGYRASCYFGAHGDDRIDPYFWLRDDQRTDPDVLAYLQAENRYTAEIMAPLKPLMRRLYRQMRRRQPSERRSAMDSARLCLSAPLRQRGRICALYPLSAKPTGCGLYVL